MRKYVRPAAALGLWGLCWLVVLTMSCRGQSNPSGDKAEEYFSYVPGAPQPKLFLSDCRPPMDYYFNGRELITYCPRDHRVEGERCPLSDDEENYCARVFVQRLDGAVLTKSRAGKTVPILKRRNVCQGGRWIEEIVWKSGSVFLAPDRLSKAVPECKPGDRAPRFEL